MRLLIAVLSAALSFAAFAEYPDRPIKLIVPFAAGAGTDAVARFTAQKLEEQLKQPVVVDNRVGASGAIGTQAVATAAADGYTLLFVASPFTTVAAATPATANYDPIKQLAPEAVFVFLVPGSFDELRTRLQWRRTESADQIERRLQMARREMDALGQFDYVVLNREDHLDDAVGQIRAIIVAEKHRVRPRRVRL